MSLHRSSGETPIPASPFERFEPADVSALIAEFPLAWVVAQGGGEASLLPLVGVYDEAGGLVELIGHFALTNPLHAALTADPRAVILFQGPQGYVSPEHAGRRDWGPTWNYAQLSIQAEVTIEPDRTEAALNVLIEAVESPRAAPWRADELGTRYPRLLAAITGFRARVTGLTGRFKLGQDERLEVLRAILASHPDPALRRWMHRFNEDRA